MYDPRNADSERRLVDLLSCTVADRYGLERIDLPERQTPDKSVKCLDHLDDTLRDFASLTDLESEAIGLGRRIAIEFCNRRVVKQAYGPTLRSANGTAQIVLQLEGDDIEDSAHMFAHQWGQIIVGELRNGPEPGPQLAAALVDALRDGLPGTAASTTAHATRLTGLGARTRAALHAMLIGTSFEAFIENESEFRSGLDTNRMWREPAAGFGSGIDREEARACQGWPTGAEKTHAFSYWRQLLAAIQIHANGISATEGGSVIARAELETKRQERRLRERERQYAGITLASQTEELGTLNMFASLSTHGNEAHVLVADAKHAYMLEYPRRLAQDQREPCRLDSEGLRFAEIACEGDAVRSARGAQVASLTVCCTFDASGETCEHDDYPGENITWTIDPQLRRITDIGPELLGAAQLIPTDKPHGYDLMIVPLMAAFELTADRILHLLQHRGWLDNLASRSFSVQWTIEGTNWRDGMRITVVERRGRQTHAVLSDPTRYRDLVLLPDPVRLTADVRPAG